MKWFEFDFENGYAAEHTEDTIKTMRLRKVGRPKIRFNIIKRDGKCTVVISNITFSELQTYRTMAEKQGNKIW